MLAHPTLDLLHTLGLHRMAKGYQELDANPEARSLEHAEWLGLLLEHEVTRRRQKRFETRARAARGSRRPRRWRDDAGSLLIASQLPVDRWYDIIAIPTLADAVLDRVVHNAYRIELSGESLRKRQAPQPTP